MQENNAYGKNGQRFNCVLIVMVVVVVVVVVSVLSSFHCRHHYQISFAFWAREGYRK